MSQGLFSVNSFSCVTCIFIYFAPPAALSPRFWLMCFCVFRSDCCWAGFVLCTCINLRWSRNPHQKAGGSLVRASAVTNAMQMAQRKKKKDTCLISVPGESAANGGNVWTCIYTGCGVGAAVVSSEMTFVFARYLCLCIFLVTSCVNFLLFSKIDSSHGMNFTHNTVEHTNRQEGRALMWRNIF